MLYAQAASEITFMKKVAITVIIIGVIGIGFFAYWRFNIHSTVQNACSQYAGTEQWIGCAADVAMQKQDASYCWAGGLFSPFTGSCMAVFADEVEDESACTKLYLNPDTVNAVVNALTINIYKRTMKKAAI